MEAKDIRAILPKPRLTLDRLGQITFTIKEVTKLVFRIKPKLLVIVFILNAILGFSSVPTFYLEKLIIDNLVSVVKNPDWQPVFYSTILLVGLSLFVSLVRNILSSINGFLRRNLSRYFDAELDALLGNKISQLSLATLENPEFRDRFNKVERESGRRAWELMIPISDIPNYLVGFISASAVLILVHPLISVGIFIVSIPRFFVNSKFIKEEYNLHTELAPKHRIWSWVRNYLVQNRNFMEMRILGLSDYLTEKMRKVVKEILSKREKLSRKREIWGFFSSLPLSLYEFGISVFLVFWVVIGKITVGSLQLYLRSLRSAEQNLTGLVSSFLDIYENYIYVTDLIWFLGLTDEEENSGIKKYTPDEDNLKVEFKNVWFKYQKKQQWVIRNISFSISPGEKIAFVGVNGAGKSTLIKLLAGFYYPQKGEILVGGYRIEEIDLVSWRKKLAILFQEFELYPFSVKEAIGYGDVERLENSAEIKEAAVKTGIDEFVDSLSQGYDTPLAPELEGGIRPSIGQWQRFGLSRMLFRKYAKVLILDEPTSNVDPEAEEKIFEELAQITKNKILVFVTQRFSTVRIADRIFVIEAGKLIEEGTHKHLIKLGGKYARLYNLQAQAYINSN